MQELTAVPRQPLDLPTPAHTPLAAVLAAASTEAGTPHIWGILPTPSPAVQVPGARSTAQTASKGTRATASSQTCQSLHSTLKPARPPCCRWTLQTAMLLRSEVLEGAIRAFPAGQMSGRRVSAVLKCSFTEQGSGPHGVAHIYTAERDSGMPTQPGPPECSANCNSCKITGAIVTG